MRKVRQTLAIKVATPGGDNPLLMSLVAANAPYYRGTAVSGLALVGRGGTAPYSFVKLTGTIPTGLTLHTDGTFIGTPSVPGRFTFVAEVTDSASDTFAHAFSIDILSPLFLVGGLPQDGEIAVVYDYQFVVRDETGTTIPSGYSINAGSLPPGLSMNSSGHITGTPTVPAGISYATLKVISGPDTLLVPFTITIFEAVVLTFAEDRDPPAGWGGGPGTWLPSMIRGIQYTASLVITGGCPPYSLSASQVDPLPSGINLLQQRKVIAGKTMDAAAPQPFLLAIQVTDAVGGIDLAQRAFFIIDAQQGRVMPQRNGADVSGGDGPLNWSFKEGSGISITATNDGETVEYTFDASGAAGNFIDSINGIGPDSNGNLQLVSHNSSLIFSVDSNGDLNIQTTGGGGSGTVTNVSSGNLSPLFTVNVTNPTTTPAFAFTAVNQNANLIYAGPATGAAAAPTFRSLVTADFPASGVTAASYTYASITVDATGRITSASNGATPQVAIQFKDEGSNLGTSGTATSVDFVGAGVTATRVSDAVTVTINAATAAVPMLYGDGSDGAVLLDGTNTFSFMSKSVAVYTLNRDIYVTSLSSNGTGTLLTNGFRIFCYTSLDLSSFPAGGISRNGNAGALSINETSGGVGGGNLSANSLGASASAGSNGGGGTTGVGSNGAAVGAATNANGGAGGVGGTGGAGTSAAGSGGTVGSITPYVYRRPTPDILAISVGTTINAINGGQGGSGGGAGGGSGAGTGAAGGGGGGGAGVIYIAAHDIVKPTNAGALQAVGGAGGLGATRTAGTNVGGGAGGAGGGGGLIHLVYNSTSGSGTGTIVATGGAAGNGGSGRAGGANGGGGTGGTGGLILLFNIGAGTTTAIAGSAGSAPSGGTGGAGGSCSTTL